MKKKILKLLGIAIICSSSVCHAWGPVYHHGGGGYYGPGFYPGWGVGPNVIINVPIVPAAPPPMPYYRPVCQTVEVCDQFNSCWLERHCS